MEGLFINNRQFSPIAVSVFPENTRIRILSGNGRFTA